MNINKNNYESWFLDYHEGTLAAEKVAELFLFLEKYPEFKNEFESFAQITLPLSEEEFSLKDDLKKNTITTLNYSDYLIAELEGDLNLQERVALQSFMDAHPELEKEKLLFSKTIMQKEIVAYPAKAELKKRVLGVQKSNSPILWMAVAAMILLLIGVYFIQRPEKVQVAEKQNNNAQNAVDEQLNNIDKVVAMEKQLEPTKEINKQDQAANSHLPIEESKTNITSPTRHKKTKPVNTPTIDLQKNNAELAMSAATKIETSLLITANEEQPEKINAENKGTFVPTAKRSLNPITIFDNVKTAAANKVNNATGDEIFYTSSETNSISEERMPLKSRMIKLMAWTINKVSFDNVKLTPDFDMDGDLMAYQLSAGKFKVEKNF